MEKHPLDIQVEEFASPIEAFATENMTLVGGKEIKIANDLWQFPNFVDLLSHL